MSAHKARWVLDQPLPHPVSRTRKICIPKQNIGAFMHTSIHAFMHTSIHPYMHSCIHPYMHTFYTFIHAYTCIYICFLDLLIRSLLATLVHLLITCSCLFLVLISVCNVLACFLHWLLTCLTCSLYSFFVSLIIWSLLDLFVCFLLGSLIYFTSLGSLLLGYSLT
jgi:hypothetical protein